MRKEADLWWRQGQRDLQAARSILKVGEYFACAFFSQQAAEKALKAVYIQRSKRLAPFTHNLNELGKLCQVPKRLKQPLVELNPDYLTARYPDAANGVPAEAFTEINASRHLKYADLILKWCDRILNPKPRKKVPESKTERS